MLSYGIVPVIMLLTAAAKRLIASAMVVGAGDDQCDGLLALKNILCASADFNPT